jgi:ParB-like chromosome segregation protein Spo0J
MASEQLSLPYEVIEKVAGRPYIRNEKKFKISNNVAYKTAFKNLSERDAFNSRTIYDGIEEFAEFIYNHGLPEPFTVDVLHDGRVLIEKGHRRFRAINLLISQGRFDPETEVEFWPNNNEVTELQRMVNQFTSNNHQKPLQPIDQSTVAFAVKYNYGEEISNEKIAEMFGVSRQTIDNLLLIAKAPDDVKNQVRLGTMSFTDAVAFVRAQKKQSKAADKAEEESHKTQATVNLEPQDALKEEMQELEQLEQQAEDYKEKQAELEKRRMEKLYEVANEVLVNKEALTEQIGKKLAAPAMEHWTEDFVNEESGEVVTTPCSMLVMKEGIELTELTIEDLLSTKCESVFIFKTNPIAESVITEQPAEKEKGKYDEDRPEIAQVQNAIKLGDRISVRVEKLEIGEGDKKDLTDWVKWMQNDLLQLRDWVHSNKKQNKMR